MDQKQKEREKGILEVVIKLKGLVQTQEEKWPNFAAYLFTRSGRFLEKTELKKDTESPSIGRGRFQTAPEEEMLVVKVAPDVEDVYDLNRYQPLAARVVTKPGRSVTMPFHVDMKRWLCWLRYPYVVTGNVEKDLGDHKIPVCHGDVDIYEVDINCIYRLDPGIIEKIRAAIIDIIVDPPPIRIPREPVWPDWEDDDYCGTGPRPPVPPKHLDIRSKLVKLPPDWSFAVERHDRLSTAEERMNAFLKEMDISEKQAFISSEVFEGVKASSILYSNTRQFQELLVEKFQAFRFCLCWYPWIYWLWWPHCWYSLNKIGTAEIQPDGSFTETVWISVCNRDTPDLWFVVRQKIGSIDRTIYKRYPIPCNTYWNHPNGTPVSLVVTDPDAIACQPDPGIDLSSTDMWIVPLAVGNYSLKRIYGTGAGILPTTNADPKTGLYESIHTGLGGSLSTFHEGPFGGTLGLRYLFSKALESAGVKYYRIKYRSNGAGDWIPLNHEVVRHYSDYDPVSHILSFPSYKLGPGKVGIEDDLFEIPPETPPNAAADPTAAWVVINAGVDLMNGYLDTTKIADGFVDFKMELFDGSGSRVDPASFGGGILFRLPANDDIWNNITTADPAAVNSDLLGPDPEAPAFQAFIFRLVIDNHKPVAVIDEPVVAPSGNSTDTCGMTRYEATDTYLTMPYQARHPERFALYRFWLYKAANNIHTIEGQAGDMGASGSFIVDPAHTGISLIVNLMGGCPEAAFSENLHVWHMNFNGWHRVGPDASAVRAFALTPPRP